MSFLGSFVSFVTLRDFKPQLADPKFPLAERFSAHGVNSFAVVVVGEKRYSHLVSRKGNGPWADQSGEPGMNSPTVLFLTSRSATCEARELPAMAGGNTDSSLAEAVCAPDRARTLLRERYEADRRYHLVPYRGSRWALVFSVKDTDVRHSEAEVERQGLRLVNAWCGLASAARYALLDQPTRFPEAKVIVVMDAHLSLVLRVRGGSPETEPAPMEVGTDSASISALRDLIAERIGGMTGGEGTSSVVAVYSTAHALSVDPRDLESQSASVSQHHLAYSDLCFA